MIIEKYSFKTIDWRGIKKEKHAGLSGFAWWQVVLMGDIRIRMVEYSADYTADHWCNKGHVIYCIRGKMKTELKDGRKIKLIKGMTYHVGDNSDAHRSSSKKGCTLFIVD